MKNLGTIATQDHVIHLAWDGDGAHLLVTPASGPIVVVDKTASLLGELPDHGMGNGLSAWFHGEPATCGFDGKIRWNGQEWAPGRGLIDRVKTSPDGSHLAAAQAKSLHIFDRNGLTTHGLSGLVASVVDFAWNPDAPAEIATTGAGGATLWRLGEKEPFARFDWGGASLLVEWSGDGRWLATGDQTPSVHVYDISRDHPLHIEGFESKVQALAFSHNSKKLATAGSPVVTVWPTTGKKGPEGAAPIQIEGSETPVTTLAFSPATGQLASGDESGILLVVTFESGQFRRKRARLESGISSLCWHPSLPLLAIGHTDGKVMILSLA